MKELSILIPSRSEMFLKNTIEDALKNSEADTEIIAVLDGAWSDPQIEQNDKVNVIYVPESIGQRAATNLACKLAKGKYVMKIDAHCSFDKGFDKKMIAEMKTNYTMVPTMRNLWAFDWKCMKCGKKWYQGPTPTKCQEANYIGTGKPCDSTVFKRKMMWVGKERPQSNSYCFDSEPHFKYFNEYTKTEKYKKDLETGLTETMSLQGSCFMCTKKKYLELNLCDESVGSWGNQGIEVSMKTRLSGGKVIVNHKTWYSHLFRTQGGDFGFPYRQSGNEVARTKKKIRDLFFNNMWDKQIYPLSKVIDQFYPVNGWSDEDINKLKENELKTERSGIYSIKSLANGRIYIGSAINIANRIFEHSRKLKQNSHCNVHLQNTWNKYGENDLKFEVLYFCKEKDLLKNEQRFIDEYKDKIGWDNMFNINPMTSSSLGRECSEETKEKISISQTGKKAWNKGLTKETDERIKKYANKLNGQNIWENKEHPRGMLGKIHTEKTKEKIGFAQRGIPKSDEHNRKNSESHIGKIFSKEHRNNLSLAQKNLNRKRNEKGQYFNS